MFKLNNNSISDRLYLSKRGQEIFVDLHNVPQHQVDGVRYLYRQFKKNKPGVILNDPPSYGKRHQLLLFIKAIHHVLVEPILVLCDESDCDKWQGKLCKWTHLNNTNQIITQTSKNISQWTTCRVMIVPAVNAKLYSQLQWSIIVIDGGDSKNVLRNYLNGFKIWIMSVDMKEHLNLFTSIYNWFYPKAKLTDLDTKSYYALDAYMEDIVLRRNDVIASENKNINNKTDKEQKPVSKKNKDASGTKIKRSKRRHQDEDLRNEANTHIKAYSARRTVEKGPEIKNNNKDQVKVTRVESMDVESFIRNHKPITSEKFEEFVFDDVAPTNKNKSSDLSMLISHDNNKACDFNIVDLEIETNNEENETNLKISNVDNELGNDVKLFEDIVDDNGVEHEDIGKNFKITNDLDAIGSDCNGIDLKEDTVKANITISDLEFNCLYKNDINLKTSSEVTTSEIELDCDENKVDIKLNNEVAKATNKGELNSTQNKDYIKNDLERQIFDLEQEAINKFKGSLLDSIF